MYVRLAFTLFASLLVAHTLTLGWVVFERMQVTRSLMHDYLGPDVAGAVAVLDRLPSEERAAWLPRLARPGYQYRAGAPPAGETDTSRQALAAQASLAEALGAAWPGTAGLPISGDDPARFYLGLRLSDGSPYTLVLNRSAMSFSLLTVLVLLLQLGLLAGAAWWAVRAATRPLQRLADAADQLDLNHPADPLPETGPADVARAAQAFNTMRARVALHVAERLRILAAVSHDLQTPITRMRLRADLLESESLRDKMQADLAEMQSLVEEGMAYARSATAHTEAVCRTDLHALLDSLVCDYTDAGQSVHFIGAPNISLFTRPLALKRVVTNLIDNALKFAGEAELRLGPAEREGVDIVVLDHGPGIPPAELEAVLQPFYRVEASRNRELGGTGLGLATVQQLAGVLGAGLNLRNRPEGGLEVRLKLPRGGDPPATADS